jgi:hypothetical protein
MPATLEALATHQAAVDAARQAMLARRLRSWLASEPAPVDIVDTLYQVANCLNTSLPGGLTTATADIFLDILCQCLLYCDLDDFLVAWPCVQSRP